MRKWFYSLVIVAVLVPTVARYWEHRPALAEAPPASVSVPAPYTPPPVVPAPEPVVPPPWSKAQALEAAVTKTMATFSGEYSVVVFDLEAGQQWSINAEQRYHPASTIKMPVSLYALEQYRANKLGWQDGIVYTEADFESPGGGAFETSPFGGVYPVANLVGRALRYSNNVAVNMLGRHLGWENIRAWTRTIDGELYRAEDGTPEVTALSELGWWRHLERLSRTDPKAALLVLQPLREVAYDGRIAAGLPAGVPYLHKFGSYAGNFHDAGWIQGNHPFLLVIMTHGATEEEADTAIAQVTGVIYAIMMQEGAWQTAGLLTFAIDLG